MGPRAGLDTVSKRKIPSSHRDSNIDHPIVQPVVSRYTDRRLQILIRSIFHGSIIFVRFEKHVEILFKLHVKLGF
jgi:hypothetical protein